MKALLTLGLCLLAPEIVLAAKGLSAKPNIVLIISDDHAWTDYGFMGHPQIETPNLDKLATRSAVFTRGYVPTALCRPALATLATGLYAQQHPRTERRPQLFDLLADPHEDRNLAAEHPEVVARLAAQLQQWWPVNERQVLTNWSK